MKADLTKKATLAGMKKLDDTLIEIERPGSEPTTAADDFNSRAGYNTGFLDGWNIALPRPTNSVSDDVQQLKRGGTGSELKYHHFSVVMSKSRRMPMLTAVNIDGTAARKVRRISTWSFDGRLDAADQWGDELYFENELDRGHMVRREDPIWGTPEDAKQANDDTFHFTNSCPQMAGVNQVTWLGLENHILRHTREDNMKVNVFTGPIFKPNDLEYRGAKIPGSFWKVVTIVTDDGRPSATAYLIRQEEELQELEFVFAGYKTYQVSIKEVMELTGINFTELLDFDGFSQRELSGKSRISEPIEELEMVRI
jgi:endonuclease G, mitochondrial